MKWEAPWPRNHVLFIDGEERGRVVGKDNRHGFSHGYAAFVTGLKAAVFEGHNCFEAARSWVEKTVKENLVDDVVDASFVSREWVKNKFWQNLLVGGRLAAQTTDLESGAIRAHTCDKVGNVYATSNELHSVAEAKEWAEKHLHADFRDDAKGRDRHAVRLTSKCDRGAVFEMANGDLVAVERELLVAAMPSDHRQGPFTDVDVAAADTELVHKLGAEVVRLRAEVSRGRGGVVGYDDFGGDDV